MESCWAHELHSTGSPVGVSIELSTSIEEEAIFGDGLARGKLNSFTDAAG